MPYEVDDRRRARWSIPFELEGWRAGLKGKAGERQPLTSRLRLTLADPRSGPRDSLPTSRKPALCRQSGVCWGDPVPSHGPGGWQSGRSATTLCRCVRATRRRSDSERLTRADLSPKRRLGASGRRQKNATTSATRAERDSHDSGARLAESPTTRPVSSPSVVRPRPPDLPPTRLPKPAVASSSLVVRSGDLTPRPRPANVRLTPSIVARERPSRFPLGVRARQTGSCGVPPTAEMDALSP
jgi:hypothetical protein